MPELSADQAIVFAILIVAFGLLITERLRNDIVAILIVVALSATGVLEPKEAVSGFSSEPAIVVAAIFVLSGGLHQTGLSDTIGGWIGRLAGSSFSRAIAVIMPSVAVLSAFTHHVTTTAVMLPVTLNLAREREISPSKLLMPLSFAASLGTTITIIGAPAFLIADGVLEQAGRPGLSVFSITPIGLALSAAGTVFILLVGRFLLPERAGTADQSGRFRLDDYFTELKVLPDSPLMGKTVDELHEDTRYQFEVAGWLRRGRSIPRPYGGRTMEEGDVLLIRTTPDQMLAFRTESQYELNPVHQYGQTGAASEDLEDLLVQAVVAPRSDLAGRTIGEVDFHRRYGAIVLGLWRRDGWLGQELARIRLRPGDVLVLQGEEEDLARVENDSAFLMLVPFHGETQVRRKAPVAGAIMAAAILLTAFNVLTLEIAALAGAVAMVLSRCLTARQAYRSIDARIFVFIAGAIPLGTAMQKSGASDRMAGWLQGAVEGLNETVVLLAIFWVVAVLTQFMSDSATTAIFGPVAAALASALGQAPEPYVVTVAMAAVTAFLTPIGHHGNLLIYGPGGYRFADFVRAGAPLTVVVSVIVVLLSQMLW